MARARSYMPDELAGPYNTIDNVGVPLHALGTGLLPVPPSEDELPELTRGLPDYAERSPAELAQMRTRMGVKPQQGRPDITPEHAAATLATIGSAYLAPEMAAARAVMSTGRAGATALTALGSYLYGTEQPNAEEAKTPAQYRQEQEVLKAAGHYTGEIDGKDGPKLRAAREKAAAAKAQEIIDAERRTNERLRLENEGKAAGVDEQKTKNEAERLKNEAARLLAEQQGNARLKEVEASTPPWRKALREYGPPIGYLVGYGVGAGTRAGAMSRATSKMEARNKSANDIFETALAGSDKAAVNQRAARVNEFYRQGGGSEPFVSTAGDPAAQYAFKVADKAPNPSKLYGAPRVSNALTDLGANGLFMADMGYAMHAGEGAKQDLEKAISAFKESPNEANIQAIQTARDQVAWYEFLKNAGRAAGISYVGHAAIHQRPNVKPDMSRAEAERFNVEDILRAPPPAPKTPRSRAPKPEPQEPAQLPIASTDPAVVASETARRESRKFHDNGETLADILHEAHQARRRLLMGTEGVPAAPTKQFFPPEL